MISQKENRLYTIAHSDKQTALTFKKHHPLFFQDGIILKSKLIERIKQIGRETSSDWKGPVKKTKIMRCSTLVNPNIAQRTKYRGLSSIGNFQESLQQNEERNPENIFQSLLKFSQDHVKSEMKFKYRKKDKSTLRRITTEASEFRQSKCIPKGDLRFIKVAIIGTKLL